MAELLILKGLPASGKTTEARKWVAEDRANRVRVNRDDIRSMLKDKWKYNSINEEIVTVAEHGLIFSALSKGISVVVDATNLNPVYLDILVGKAEGGGIVPVIDETFCSMGPEECAMRDMERGKDSVGAEVIYRMYNKYINKGDPVEVPEKFKNSKKTDPRIRDYYKGDYARTLLSSSPENVVICDLDGTLSLIMDRSPYDGHESYNDVVNFPVYSLLADMKRLGKKIFLFSGRNSDRGGEEATKEWLKDNNIEYDLLAMRKPGDIRPDVEVKRDMYNEHIKAKNQCVEFVLDDRDCMVDFWRKELMLPCFQVYYGNF